MKIKRLLVLLSALAVIAHAVSAANSRDGGGEVRISVILVEADSGDGGVDSSLRPYAGTLQRLFRFGSYREVSRHSMRLNVPGDASIALSGGQSLTLQSTGEAGPGLVADLTWSRGAKRLLHTRIHLRPGNPALLGGPRTGDGAGSLLLILSMD